MPPGSRSAQPLTSRGCGQSWRRRPTRQHVAALRNRMSARSTAAAAADGGARGCGGCRDPHRGRGAAAGHSRKRLTAERRRPAAGTAPVSREIVTWSAARGRKNGDRHDAHGSHGPIGRARLSHAACAHRRRSVTKRSGKRAFFVHMRYACKRRLRQAVYLVPTSLQHDAAAPPARSQSRAVRRIPMLRRGTLYDPSQLQIRV